MKIAKFEEEHLNLCLKNLVVSFVYVTCGTLRCRLLTVLRKSCIGGAEPYEFEVQLV